MVAAPARIRLWGTFHESRTMSILSRLPGVLPIALYRYFHIDILDLHSHHKQLKKESKKNYIKNNKTNLCNLSDRYFYLLM